MWFFNLVPCPPISRFLQDLEDGEGAEGRPVRVDQDTLRVVVAGQPRVVNIPAQYQVQGGLGWARVGRTGRARCTGC